MDAITFRADFPEFSDGTRYPDSQVNRWLAVVGTLLDPEVWGMLLDFGTGLYVAHNLALWRRNADAAAGSGVPGAGVGVVSSKSVDTVSVGYDARVGTIEGAAQWNLTTYGVQYFQLARQLGMGVPSIAMGGEVQSMTPPVYYQ